MFVVLFFLAEKAECLNCFSLEFVRHGSLTSLQSSFHWNPLHVTFSVTNKDSVYMTCVISISLASSLIIN